MRFWKTRIKPGHSTEFLNCSDPQEWDPPITFVDRFLFMPVIVCPSIRSHFSEQRNFIRPIYEGGKKMKVDVWAFVSNIQLSPSNFYLPYEIIYFFTKDGLRLHGLLLTQPKYSDRIPTIMFLHGNSGNIGDNLQWVCTMFGEIKCNIFLFDYRGYGFSPGRPTERGVYWDAQAAYDYIHQRPDINSRMIVLHGQSIGGAIAIDLAGRRNYRNQIAGLIIENTFTSLRHLLYEYTQKWYLRPCRLLFGCLQVARKFENIVKMDSVQAPTLVICGLKDKIIPPVHSERLFSRCRVPKRFYVSSEADHLTAFLEDNYVVEIKRFLSDFVVRTVA